MAVNYNPEITNNPFLKVDEDQRVTESQKQQQAENEQRKEFQRLCFETFHANESGKKLYEFLKARFLDSTLYLAPNRQADCETTKELIHQVFSKWQEIHSLWSHGLEHIQRLNGVKQ